MFLFIIYRETDLGWIQKKKKRVQGFLPPNSLLICYPGNCILYDQPGKASNQRLVNLYPLALLPSLAGIHERFLYAKQRNMKTWFWILFLCFNTEIENTQFRNCPRRQFSTRHITRGLLKALSQAARIVPTQKPTLSILRNTQQTVISLGNSLDKRSILETQQELTQGGKDHNSKRQKGWTWRCGHNRGHTSMGLGQGKEASEDKMS